MQATPAPFLRRAKSVQSLSFPDVHLLHYADDADPA
jgi:hypothetical protein